MSGRKGAHTIPRDRVWCGDGGFFREVQEKN